VVLDESEEKPVSVTVTPFIVTEVPPPAVEGIVNVGVTSGVDVAMFAVGEGRAVTVTATVGLTMGVSEV
jgi:hypothetical protein